MKWSCEPARAADVPAAIARAYHTAMQRPYGPTFVSIPEDDWDAETDAIEARHVAGEFVGDDAALRAVAEALRGSARPALVVGPGVDRDGAWDVTVELAERSGALVWVSPLSSRCSFPEDHPAFAGFLTPQRPRSPGSSPTHDLVVVLGAPVFTYHVHADGPFLAEGTTLYQLVDDPQAAAMAPVGTAVLTTLRAGVAHAARPPRPGAADPGRGGARTDGRRRRRATPISPAFVMHTVAAVDAAGRGDRGGGALASQRDARPPADPHQRRLLLRGQRRLGFGLPAAVGVALGDPTRRVICLLGDGSSLYSIQALWTAAQHDLPIAFVILNNQGYGALKALGRVMAVDKPPGVDLPGHRLRRPRRRLRVCGADGRRAPTSSRTRSAGRWRTPRPR